MNLDVLWNEYDRSKPSKAACRHYQPLLQVEPFLVLAPDFRDNMHVFSIFFLLSHF